MRLRNRLWNLGCLLVLLLGNALWAALAVAQDQASQASQASFNAVNLTAGLPSESLAQQLATKRVVFVGEIHDRYDHHLNQLEIIRRLHEISPAFAIGVEYFQQPFQAKVDDYIAGRIPEHEFLGATEYYGRWGYDYRLYAPIFRYAREQRIPVRALNVPAGIASTAARVGLEGLSEEQRAYLPQEIEPADEGYRRRLRAVFETHPGSGNFERFVEAQTVWDAGMAKSAAAYLNADAEHRLVILAGSGHVAFGSGIPSRLKRLANATHAIVLSAGEEIEPGMADYVLLSGKQELPPAGGLGVDMQNQDGECRIRSVTSGGAGEKAGLKKGDVLVALDGQPVKAVADVRLALWDKVPGDRVRISVRRKRLFWAAEHDFDVELAAAPKSGEDD